MVAVMTARDLVAGGFRGGFLRQFIRQFPLGDFFEGNVGSFHPRIGLRQWPVALIELAHPAGHDIDQQLNIGNALQRFGQIFAFHGQQGKANYAENSGGAQVKTSPRIIRVC
jgi:hypothetical protein